MWDGCCAWLTSTWAWPCVCSGVGWLGSTVLCSTKDALTHPTQLTDGETEAQRRQGLAHPESGLQAGLAPVPDTQSGTVWLHP